MNAPPLPAVPPTTRAGIATLMAQTRLVSRASAVQQMVTLAQIADGHKPQLELMERCSELDPDGSFKHRNVIAICSRRAAKSTSICGILATDGSQYDGVQIYFGRNKPAVRLSIWTKIWKPFLLKHFGPPGRNYTNSESMITTFASGGIVAFTGTDDVAHIENYLGNKLRRAILDEVQAQPSRVLNPLIDRILPPALSDTGGQMILAGTIPEVPAGEFYKIWMTGRGWLKRNWSRFENPHMGTVAHQMAELEKWLESRGRMMDDPMVQRDYFGKFVFDKSATAYQFDSSKSSYLPTEPDWMEAFVLEYAGDPLMEHIHRTLEPDDSTARHGVMAAKPLPGIEVFACAIDPGNSDRFSIEVVGWGTGTQTVQHVFEFSSARDAEISWSMVDPIRRLIQERYAPSWWYYDAGGSKVVLDTFVGDTGLPGLMPAQKASAVHHQVKRVSDLARRGWLQVMSGSALEEDLVKCRWDAGARAKMEWKMSSLWHPDPADAFRYALEAYFDIYDAPEKEKTPEERDREQHAKQIRRAAARRMANVLPEDADEDYARQDLQENEGEGQW
jgi:hypothetical protein